MRNTPPLSVPYPSPSDPAEALLASMRSMSIRSSSRSSPLKNNISRKRRNPAVTEEQIALFKDKLRHYTANNPLKPGAQMYQRDQSKRRKYMSRSMSEPRKSPRKSMSKQIKPLRIKTRVTPKR